MNLTAPPPITTLLLDDDPFMLDILHDLLAELGSFAVHAEQRADRALAYLVAQPPALLVCDLSMPDMDGIEFMQAAAQAGFRGQVMLLSGMDGGVRLAAEHLARAHGLQVIGAYQKPITRTEMAGALAGLLQGHAAQHSNSHNLLPLLGK